MSAEAVRNVVTAKREMKDHDLIDEPSRLSASKGVRYEKRPVKGADGEPVSGLYNAWIMLDNPTQFNSYTTEMVKAVILAFRAASAARDVVARRLHRHGRQGVLHRREHQGICRVLRRQPAGIPAVHAPLQRHGIGDPRLRQAGDLRRQRHAHRRRAGDRHGLRFLRSAGPRALRPGGPEARFGANRRGDRFPSCSGRRRAGDGRMRTLRAVLCARGLFHGYVSPTSSRP